MAFAVVVFVYFCFFFFFNVICCSYCKLVEIYMYIAHWRNVCLNFDSLSPGMPILFLHINIDLSSFSLKIPRRRSIIGQYAGKKRKINWFRCENDSYRSIFWFIFFFFYIRYILGCAELLMKIFTALQNICHYWMNRSRRVKPHTCTTDAYFDEKSRSMG